MYGLSKINKPGNTMRPIISNIGSPTYKLAKWLMYFTAEEGHCDLVEIFIFVSFHLYMS